MSEEQKNVIRLTRDATLGQKMKLVAGLYAKKMGRAADNSAPFQMARDVRDSWRGFKSDMRDMGQFAKEEFNYSLKSMRVRRKLATRAAKNWVKNSAKGVVNWTGQKIKQGATYVSKKAKETASKLWNKFKQSKFAKGVAQRYTQAKNGVVKTAKTAWRTAKTVGMVAVTPVIVTYKAGAAVYNGVNKAYNNTKNWFNEKAEVAARLQAQSAHKPNEQMQETAEQNVSSDAVNETTTRGLETETQKKVEQTVNAEQEKGNDSNKTVETQAEQHESPTPPTQTAQEIVMTPNVQIQQNQDTNPLSTIRPKKWEALQKATEKMKKDYEKCMKAGRPQEATKLLANFENRLTNPDHEKGNFHLSEEQAQAYKVASSKDFEPWKPKVAQQKSIDMPTFSKMKADKTNTA